MITAREAAALWRMACNEDEDRARAEATALHDCRWCGARAGSLCVFPDGEPRIYSAPHKRRRVLYAEKTLAERYGVGDEYWGGVDEHARRMVDDWIDAYRVKVSDVGRQRLVRRCADLVFKLRATVPGKDQA